MSIKLSKFCYKDNILYLCIIDNNTRKYIKVKGLINPNKEKWNYKTQQYDDASVDALSNNELLKSLSDMYSSVINDNPDIESKEILVMKVNNTFNQQTHNYISLGEFIQKYIKELKEGLYNKPSRVFQVYITLLHSLEKEGNIINKPLKDINDDDFKNYGNWLNRCYSTTGKSQNYTGKMIHFHAIMQIAYKDGYTTNNLTYNLRNKQPYQEKRKKEIRSLSKKQYSDFVNLDLSRISYTGMNPKYYKMIYKDFCIIVCELHIRPVDVIKLNWNDIKYNSKINKMYFEFIPEKKKNNSPKVQIVYINSELAINIFNKYKGKSKANYVFPFTMNDRLWNLDNPNEFHLFDNKKSKILYSINKFLKKVQTVLDIDFNLVIYTFRHTGITLELSEGIKHPALLAIESGTSIQMFDKTYLDNSIAVHEYYNKTDKK